MNSLSVSSIGSSWVERCRCEAHKRQAGRLSVSSIGSSWVERLLMAVALSTLNSFSILYRIELGGTAYLVYEAWTNNCFQYPLSDRVGWNYHLGWPDRIRP